MKITQFDAKTKGFFTTEIDHHGLVGQEDGWHILGEGYYVIVNPDSKYVSFCKAKKDICFGDIVSDIIPNYTNQQYVDDYGDKLTGVGKTVREHMKENCRMDIN